MTSDLVSHIFDLIEENRHQIEVNLQLIQTLSYDADKYKQIRLLQKSIETRQLKIQKLRGQLKSAELTANVV